MLSGINVPDDFVVSSLFGKYNLIESNLARLPVKFA
jgi:hypothetical protein